MATFETGPILNKQGRTARESLASWLLAVEPPTGFSPEFLTKILEDPADYRKRRQMTEPLTATVQEVSQSPHRTVMHIEVNSVDRDVTAAERLGNVTSALMQIIGSEDEPLEVLAQRIQAAQDQLFNTNEG